MTAEPTDRFALPPVTTKASGEPRRIGVELELGGLDVEFLSGAIAEQIGGTVEAISRYEHRVHGDPAGPWIVELDFTYLRERARSEDEADDGPVDQLLRLGAEQVAPMEVVSPPLPMARLGECQRLVERFRAAGALGTSDSITYAFGMQLNPEMPATDAATVLAYLRAYLCLADWLRERAEVDITRRVTAFAEPFPRAYVRRVIASAYAPTLTALIDDYLTDNPTRNRALDLLPLFAHVDPERVRAAVPDRRVKARPALHYRLPNSDISEPDWGIHVAWRDWLQVEHLAADEPALRGACDAYASFLSRPVVNVLESWSEHVGPWLKDAL